MSEMLEKMVESPSSLGNVGDVKCRMGSDDDSAPCDGKLNRDVVGGDIEQAERKKKTRRRKAKRKNPYQKQTTENRGKKNMRLRESKNTYEQPVAPYNSNRFLIEDHNDLQDFDVKLMAVANRMNGEPKDPSVLGTAARTGRVRDASFTSAESDEDFFYSSPEDEEEFLSKEFSNTYRDLHVESLTNMSKPDLIQTILQLEEKVDSLQKRLDSEGDVGSTTNEGSKSPVDQTAQFQTEISKLVLANQRLVSENAKLREVEIAGGGSGGGGGGLSSSSEDSESDSSSSSESSENDDVGDPPVPGSAGLKINGDATPPRPQGNT